MPFNESVYKHDYKPPSTFKFSGLHSEFKVGELCCCLRKDPHVYSCDLPPYISGKLKLNTPEEGTNHAIKFDCENKDHLRVMKILKSCHPEIYKEIQGFSAEQLKVFLLKQRLKTVYQKDYGGNKTWFIGKGEASVQNQEAGC